VKKNKGMIKMDIKVKIKEFLQENYIFDSENGLDDDDSLLENGIIDSTGVLELILFLEENLQIKVNDDEILPENLDSVNNICNFAKNKIS
jgi:acyl carrier protein